MLDDGLISAFDMANGAASVSIGNARKAPTRSNDRRRMMNPGKIRCGRN
jgi:hypothetical protein